MVGEFWQFTTRIGSVTSDIISKVRLDPLFIHVFAFAVEKRA